MLAKRLWLILFVAIAGFYFWGLGLLPLVGPDEPRYAEVAREMFLRRDLITPTLGGLPWFEKPPLLYWLMMASYRVFGVTEFAARVGPVLCGLLTASFVYWIAGRVNGANLTHTKDLAKWSPLVFLSSLGVIAFGRAGSHDIVLTMTLTGALACFFVWSVRTGKGSDGSNDVREPGASPLLIGFYLFVGLSLLAKGLIGIVIPSGVIAIYFLLRREWPTKSLVLSLLWGLPLAFAVAAVWYGPMIYRHGWTFVDQFIIQHHFARFATNKYHHPAPFYFYVPVLAGLALPWTMVLLTSFASARRWSWRGDAPLDRMRVFALAWVVVPVIFFSFSESKLPAYILPVMPAVALLVGERVSCFLQAQRGQKILRFTGLLLIALAFAGGWYAHRSFSLSLSCIVVAMLPLVVTATAALLRPQLRKLLFLLIPLATFMTSVIALNCAAPVVARKESVRDLLAAAGARGYGATHVVQLHGTERTAEFYAAGRLDYGQDGEPVKLEGANQVADAAGRSGDAVLCFVPLQYEQQLTTYQRIRTEVIGNNGRVSLVAAGAPR